MIDERSDASGAEAVVDVDDGDIGRAGVQHTEQSGNSTERRAIADAGGDCQHWGVDQAGDDGWQGALHAGADDEQKQRLREATVSQIIG